MSALKARDIAVRLGGRRVVEAVTLALRAGEVTAVVGPNGAGKSTMMTVLAGLRQPDGGEVLLDGVALSAMGARERARRLGYLPQSPEIAWALEVESFVGLGRTPHRGALGQSAEDRAAVAEALAATGLSDFVRRDVTSLSGGERARALIARALAGRPAWLLADEPLTGLDPGHQLDTAALLRRFAKDGGGVLVTLHDLSFAARIADRVVVMAQGRVIADGAPAAALTPDVLARAYGLDARWIDGRSGPLLDISDRHG